MKTKIFLQEILIKMFGNTWLFAWWIKKHRLDDRIVDFLIVKNLIFWKSMRAGISFPPTR